MKRKSYVYKHTRTDKNEVFYIGIGCTKNYKRAYSHGNRNKWWKNIVNKTDYEVEIVEDKLTWDEACKLEIDLIKEYGRKDLSEGTLVNLTDGGEGSNGRTLTEETKKKISKTKKGKTSSEETKQKLSEAHRKKNDELSDIERKELFGRPGEDNPMYGKKHTEEAKRKMSEAKKGNHHGIPNPVKDKTYDEFYGIDRSIEIKKKLSEAQKGENNGFYGKTHTEETKRKISEVSKSRIHTEETKRKISETLKGRRDWNKGKEIFR